jgi:hypothetical protein
MASSSMSRARRVPCSDGALAVGSPNGSVAAIGVADTALASALDEIATGWAAALWRVTPRTPWAEGVGVVSLYNATVAMFGRHGVEGGRQIGRRIVGW